MTTIQSTLMSKSFNGFDLLLDDNTGILSSEAGNPSLLLFESVASAVNYLKLTNSATGNPVLLDGTGSDVDVGVDLRAKGDGNLRFYQDAGTTLQATIGDGLILGTGTTEPGAGNLALDLKGIFDGAANEQLLFEQVPSAVNYLQISNSASVNAPVLAATGIDVTAQSRAFVARAGVRPEWLPLVDQLEPVMWYARLLATDALAARRAGREMPLARPYHADTPLDRVADGLPPERGAPPSAERPVSRGRARAFPLTQRGLLR